jgi:hypothetical protein
MHKILKEKHGYTIITGKELHKYLMDELATHGIAGNHHCRRKIHHNKLLKLFCTLL